ncbi:MAG: MFS transporter [Solirubrobacteraceae bacterium]
MDAAETSPIKSGSAPLDGTGVPPAADRRRWIGLYVLCVGMLMIVLDVTVVNVALPSIERDLRFSQSSLAWVVNAYLITFGGLLLLAGRFGDLLGHRRVFLAGLGLFTIASALCGVAQTQTMLIAARFLQGLGGAMTSAVILGMIVTMFPEPAEQAKAIGVYGFVASAGGSIGLLAGGVLTQSINWHWIFFINLPIGIATGLAALRLLDEAPRRESTARADVPGALLLIGALILGVYTIVAPATQDGWGSSRTLGFGVGALCLLALFVLREATAAQPLIPLRVLRSRNLAAANLIQALLVAGMFGMFFMGALYLQRVLGYDALHVGLAFLPTTLVMGTMSLRYSNRLVARFGARATLLGGMIPVAVGLALFSRTPVRGAYAADVLPAMLLLGAGVGAAFPALMTLAMAGAPREDAGLASGLVNTTAQVGGALGLAVLATISAGHTRALTHQGVAQAAALTGGYHAAFLVSTGLVLAAIAVLAAVVPRPTGVVAKLPKHRTEVSPGVACAETD